MTAVTLHLTEYQPAFFPKSTFSQADGERLWRQFGHKIEVGFPSPLTDDRWQLIAKGWVGHIPLTPEITLIVAPKVPLRNLFRMWATAYDLQEMDWLDGLTAVNSLADFFEQLAYILAHNVLHRGRLGFHRAFIAQQKSLPYLRGKLNMRRQWQNPAEPLLACRYETHTTDIADNQILHYTLSQILRSRRCGETTQTAVRQAYHALNGLVSPTEFTPIEVDDRSYTRLNEDYRPHHALCRFFLEHIGPSHESGGYATQPFLINMARLYELFVANWLAQHLPPLWHIKVQEQVSVGDRSQIQFNIDLVLYDDDGNVQAVLDTKYKTDGRPTPADFNQIVTYAQVKDAAEAILIYPTPFAEPFAVMLNGRRVRALTFAIDGDLTMTGESFLNQLFE